MVSSAWSALESFVVSDLFRNLILLLAFIVAVVSVRSSKIIARKRQSCELLFHSRADSELTESLRALASLHQADNVNLRTLARREKASEDSAKSLRYVLNHWEYISVGIQKGIYDEGMLKASCYNTLVNMHEQSKPFIEGVREVSGRPTIYKEVEWLATRWGKKPLKEKK